jgi:hypothetical protein
MGNASIMARTLSSVFAVDHPRHLVELGAGDGDFLSRVAGKLGTRWQGTKATLLDRQSPINSEAAQLFRELRWQVKAKRIDVFDWCQAEATEEPAVIVANLFLHHFDPGQLEELMRGIARRSVLFVAVEPRRSLFSLAFSRLVGLIGCNAVTRHDAPVSVRAGFSGRELSGAWPKIGKWQIRERPAGIFGHIFVAQDVSE